MPQVKRRWFSNVLSNTLFYKDKLFRAVLSILYTHHCINLLLKQWTCLLNSAKTLFFQKPSWEMTVWLNIEHHCSIWVPLLEEQYNFFLLWRLFTVKVWQFFTIKTTTIFDNLRWNIVFYKHKLLKLQFWLFSKHLCINPLLKQWPFLLNNAKMFFLQNTTREMTV